MVIGFIMPKNVDGKGCVNPNMRDKWSLNELRRLVEILLSHVCHGLTVKKSNGNVQKGEFAKILFDRKSLGHKSLFEARHLWSRLKSWMQQNLDFGKQLNQSLLVLKTSRCFTIILDLTLNLKKLYISDLKGETRQILCQFYE